MSNGMDKVSKVVRGKLARATKNYRDAEANTDRRRKELQEVIIEAWNGGDGASIRVLGRETGFTYGRIGQIVRGEG